MLATVLISFGIVLVVVLGMSIGVLLGRKPLSEGGCCDGSGTKAECAGCEKYDKNGPPPGCAKT
ncbi:MAG: hypothetical protein LBK27_01875 [Treponema sp.]|jgi:hypothetical protein|nr:hypothetical protein [Treponema sp.]